MIRTAKTQRSLRRRLDRVEVQLNCFGHDDSLAALATGLCFNGRLLKWIFLARDNAYVCCRNCASCRWIRHFKSWALDTGRRAHGCPHRETSTQLTPWPPRYKRTARVHSFTDRPFARGGGGSRTAQYSALVVVVVAALQNGEHTGLEEVDQAVLTGDAAGPQAR